MKIGKIISIYFSGFLVGVALVLYPAAGNIFTDEAFHGFTKTQFGSIFLPQIIIAILASLSAPQLAKRVGMKKVLLYGLLALLWSMLMMLGSAYFRDWDYGLILLGTALLGAGFGFTITALNPFAYNLFPGRETSAVTAMHILLGAGTATSALLLNAFVEVDKWHWAPGVVGIAVMALLIFTLFVPLTLPDESESSDKAQQGIPKRVWLYAMAVFLYGACEATFGNWGALFLQQEGGLSIAQAALGLSLFWGFVAIGRVLFTLVALKYSTRNLYIAAPFLAALVFFVLPFAKGEMSLLVCMALGGLAMSFLFPKSISSATDEFPKHAALISGMLVAAIQLGTGFSAQLIGALSELTALGVLFQASTGYALFMGGIVWYLLAKPQKNKLKKTHEI